MFSMQLQVTSTYNRLISQGRYTSWFLLTQNPYEGLQSASTLQFWSQLSGAFHLQSDSGEPIVHLNTTSSEYVAFRGNFKNRPITAKTRMSTVIQIIRYFAFIIGNNMIIL